MEGRSPQPEANNPSLTMTRLALVAGASLGAALGLYLILARIPAFDRAASTVTARAVALSLNFLGVDVSAQGALLVSERLRFQVVPECTPLGPLALVAGAMLPFPASGRAKLVGIASAAVTLGLLNLVRVMSLVYIGLYLPQWLETSHLVVWQSVMILASILLWLFWVKRYAFMARS